MADRPNIPKTIVRRTPWPESSSRAVSTPLQMSVVYATTDLDALDDAYEGRAPGYTYARERHPNADVLAQKIDGLEGASGGIITSSGMAAVSLALLTFLNSGDHILGGNQLYGRSLRMLNSELPRFGIEVDLVDTGSATAVEAAIKPNTKLLLLEVVSNPTLRIADLTAIAELCKSRGIMLVVDNTFTTPRGLRPFDYGADIVLHSVTKLLAGHADVTLGYVVGRTAEMNAALAAASATWGTTASPFDCWMAERGLYSFELRYDRAEENARAVADALADSGLLKRLIYPGRTDHPDYARGQALLGGRPGNMVSFEIYGERDQANAFARGCPDIALGPTLGDIGTTISHAVTSSHRYVPVAEREALGITEGFFRLSVGVEPKELLIEELLVALEKARNI